MKKIMVANRGEIAVRIMATCRKLGIQTVAVYSDADCQSVHVSSADEAWRLGPAEPAKSYLSTDALLGAALASGADAVHPGYGFLSENAEFAQAVLDAGLVWIGPSPHAIATLSSKAAAHELAREKEVPVLPAMVVRDIHDENIPEGAVALGFPLLLKASAGGGGIGMLIAEDAASLPDQLRQASTQAQRQFGDPTLLVEPLLRGARHIEVQLVCDNHGNQLHLFERDCSSQRRRQKIIEESPAPGLSAELLVTMRRAALRLAAAVDYAGVGTVEFLVKEDRCYLLEMNTRLQVEHTVTEMVTGLDLVGLQISVARGETLPLGQDDVDVTGHAIEARIYAEKPTNNFAPATGNILDWQPPSGVRVDSGIIKGTNVGHHYDGLLCKLIAHGPDRAAASDLLREAVAQTRLLGVDSNQRLLGALLESDAWSQMQQNISLVEDHATDWAELRDKVRRECLMAATLWQFRHFPPAADLVPWPGGFQVDRESHWQLEGQSHSVSWRWLDPDRFNFPEWEQTTQIIAMDDCCLKLELNGRQVTLWLCYQGQTLWLWHPDGGSMSMHFQHRRQSAKAAGEETHCISPGPGVVIKLLVEEAQWVTTGQPLLVLESMKMETTLKAGCDGAVFGLAVKSGELVTSGQVLLHLVNDPQEHAP